MCRVSALVHTFSIRSWQNQALTIFTEHDEKDFLCVATPGAGKTTFALVAARQVLSSRPEIDRIVVVVPSAHLRDQWSDAAAGVGLILDAHHDDTSSHSHGCVTTYQSVASRPGTFAKNAESTFVIFDEIHHAGDENSWGESLVEAFRTSPLRLSLSGTPFRSDSVAIPFVRYVQDELVVDYEYGYDAALADGGVVRPVHFRRLDGHMEWIDTDGEFNSFSFAETMDTTRVQQRLKAALDPQGNWLSHSIARAHAHLQYVRRADPSAGGLVICTDHKHAKSIAALLRKLGTEPTVVLSDDAEASHKIQTFAQSDSEWIVAVRMVSEGVDIPRLCVGLFATSTTTELFFRQAVGRIVRQSGKTTEAVMFIPNDPRLVSHAQSMAQSRVHSLKRNEVEESYLPELPAFDSVPSENDEQLSMFQVLSSTPVHRDNEMLSTHGAMSSASDQASASNTSVTVSIELPPLPTDSIIGEQNPYEAIVTLRNNRKRLRQTNADLVRTIVALTGEKHAKVNNTLNSQSGISAIGKATNTELEKRIACAKRWIISTRKRRVS